jgi:predicted nucleotide-binding protein
MNRNVFIIHGHDLKSVEELKTLIRAKGLEPIVLIEQDDGGNTIIDKFERYAEQCVFAIALLTPDDVGSARKSRRKTTGRDVESNAQSRARQNVIFEMGWFFKKLGRSRTRLLHKGPVELPSDVTGIIYIPFKKSVTEAETALTRAFVSGGLIAASPVTCV